MFDPLVSRRGFIAGAISILMLPPGATISFEEAQADIAAAEEALQETPWIFEVNPDGRLSVADYTPLRLRRDLYYVSARDFEDIECIEAAADGLEPLSWELQRFYEEWRESKLEAMRDETDMAGNGRSIGADGKLDITKRPEYLEEGDAVSRFLRALTDDEVKSLQKALEAWLQSEPDWIGEYDYFDDAADGSDMAYEVFLHWDDQEGLEFLGVDVVGGEGPWSTYYAAELRGDLDEANRKAAEAGIPVRFVRTGETGSSLET